MGKLFSRNGEGVAALVDIDVPAFDIVKSERPFGLALPEQVPAPSRSELERHRVAAGKAARHSFRATLAAAARRRPAAI